MIFVGYSLVLGGLLLSMGGATAPGIIIAFLGGAIVASSS